MGEEETPKGGNRRPLCLGSLDTQGSRICRAAALHQGSDAWSDVESSGAFGVCGVQGRGQGGGQAAAFVFCGAPFPRRGSDPFQVQGLSCVAPSLVSRHRWGRACCLWLAVSSVYSPDTLLPFTAKPNRLTNAGARDAILALLPPGTNSSCHAAKKLDQVFESVRAALWVFSSLSRESNNPDRKRTRD